MGGKETFLRWENLGGGAILYEGQNSPQKTRLEGGGDWLLAGGELDTQQEEAQPIGKHREVSQNGSGEGGLARARLEIACGGR